MHQPWKPCPVLTDPSDDKLRQRSLKSGSKGSPDRPSHIAGRNMIEEKAIK